MRNPDFTNLLKVLDRSKPNRPTLFEFFLNKPLYEKLSDPEAIEQDPDWQWGDVSPVAISAYKNAGYDYVTVMGSLFAFPCEQIEHKATISLNAGHTITDKNSFNKYEWPNPDDFDYSRLARSELLPQGMKLIVWGPGGVLENVIALVGYETLCMLLYDNENLVQNLFDAVGERLVRYYEICASYDTVGALISNDDWGFKSQTMLAPDNMRKYIIPWHKKIVQAIHAAGKPAILHSCGKLDLVMEDIIEDIGYDGKHSYEDNIEPVEQAYNRLHSRIAVLGGIDVDFICRSSKEDIQKRCENMLGISASDGAYALGTGNSVPEYVPDEAYFAMIDTVRQ